MAEADAPPPDPVDAGMAPPEDLEGSDRQLGYLMDTARFMLDEQFRVAERLDSKARSQAVITAAFFAATLAAALGVTARDATSGGWVIAICSAGGVAAALVAAALIATAAALRVAPEQFVNIETLQSYSGWAYNGHPLIGKRLVDLTLSVAQDRKGANVRRSDKVKGAARWCLWSTASTTLTLVIVFIAAAQDA